MNTENEVLKWYQDKWNKPTLPFFRKPLLSPETSLSTGKNPWSAEDAIVIVQDYFATFNVDEKGFDFRRYWPNEEVFLPLNSLRTKEEKWKWVEPKPLTIKMLIESAIAGYWLYD